MLWEIVEWQRNPMQLVEIKGISKRKKKPVVLTVEQYYLILALLPEPYRTMVVVAQCTGLRAEEVLALEWEDIDFENLSMRVVRAVVHRSRQDGKDGVFGGASCRLILSSRRCFLDWKLQSAKECTSGDSNPIYGVESGLFAATSPGVTTIRLHIQQDYIRPAGVLSGGVSEVRCRGRRLVPAGQPGFRTAVACRSMRSVGRSREYDGIGWHTFRHTYRSWLDDTGAPMGVQQKLMRHAQISTTMNVYGNALMEAKREANAKVVRRHSERITMQRTTADTPESPRRF